MLAFDGGNFTVAEVTAKLQTIETLRAATEQAQAAVAAKVAAETAQLPALLLFMDAYVAFLRVTFGNAPDTLAAFKLKPRKTPTPMTAVQKAAAAAKRQATREARGITTDAKKQAIKGAVTGIVITPVVVPQASASQPAAATAPASGTSTTTHGS